MSAHDKALLALSDAELIETADLTEPEFDELENQLAIRAACLGWTGDPMRQPLETVAATVRGIISRRPDL
jgi:hypothetical protein